MPKLSNISLDGLDNLLSGDMIKSIKMSSKRLSGGEREVTLRGMANGRRLVIRGNGATVDEAIVNLLPNLAARLNKEMPVPPPEP